MRRYLYRGRHRKPTQTTQQVAVVALTGAVGFGLTQGSAGAGDRWDAVIACESGGNPRAQNPSSSASGLFQFIDGTWRAYGGGEFARRAKDATAAEQYEVANRAFAREGYRPWNASKSCWKGKTDADGGSKHRYDKADDPGPTPKTDPKSAPKSPGGGYTVRAGDTLAKIANARGVEGGWQALYERNRDAVGGNPNRIFPGLQLNL